jgi:predicted nucleic acid-binding protein
VNYLIDTNIISEVRKGSACNPRVAAWYVSIEDESIYLSALALGEIRKGIERARPKEPAKALALEKWLSTLSRSFAERILPVDRAVADEWGRMSAKRPVSTVDALLAATAKVHGMTLATRNTSHVTDLGANVLNPF